MLEVIINNKKHYVDIDKRILYPNNNRRNGQTFDKLEPIQRLEIYLQTS